MMVDAVTPISSLSRDDLVAWMQKEMTYYQQHPTETQQQTNKNKAVVANSASAQSDWNSEASLSQDQQKRLHKELSEVNTALLGKDVQVEYKIHEENQLIMVQLVDKKTGKVIREIPSEKMLDYLDHLIEQAKGTMVNEKG